MSRSANSKDRNKDQGFALPVKYQLHSSVDPFP